MTRPWETLATEPTRDGPLELRRRGDRDFLITVAGRVLMTSAAHRSEDAVATLACAALAGARAPRVLIGGLGMGYTLRAALDALPPAASVTVAELNPIVVAWCRGPLAPLTGAAVADPRVTVTVADVSAVIAGARRDSWDAIILDLYEGPHQASQRHDDPFYGAAALARARAAVSPRGVLAIWSEDPDDAFERRLTAARFTVDRKRIGGRGGRTHIVYLAT
jgi:spermidine synthase